MSPDSRVLLDACVLVPMPLADTLLRLAEEPRLYSPRWSQPIMAEVTRTLTHKWGMPDERAHHREQQIRLHFPESWVDGFESLIDDMTNEPHDRHVLAAAVKSKSELIVTYNSRHFPPASLQPWNIQFQRPSTFLITLYHLDAELLIDKLREQAAVIGRPLSQLLDHLARNVPTFVEFLRKQPQPFGSS
jgi:predicted nucleic acid-binding protein